MASGRAIRFVCFQQPSLLGSSFRRQLFNGSRMNRLSKSGGGKWRRFLAYQAKKETVRAIPVEQAATRAGWTGEFEVMD